MNAQSKTQRSALRSLTSHWMARGSSTQRVSYHTSKEAREIGLPVCAKGRGYFQGDNDDLSLTVINLSLNTVYFDHTVFLKKSGAVIQGKGPSSIPDTGRKNYHLQQT